MILYFSGAKHFQSEQRDVNQSLGGFMSSTPIPNSRLNAIFDDLSLYSLANKQQNTIAIFLYNDGIQAVSNLKMTNIYQKLFGEKINYCDFEFSVAEPTEEGFIEIIGSKTEEPFYANWFTCESIREFTKIKIITPGNVGEEISIMGNSGIVDVPGLKESADKIVEVLSMNSNLKVERLSDIEIIVSKKDLNITNESLNFSTNGSMTIEGNNFSNGSDDSVLIAEELAPKKSLGIWIKRKINDNYKKISQQEDCKILTKDDIVKVESLELLFEFD